MSLSSQRRAGKITAYLLLLGGVVFVAVPFCYMLVTSLKPQSFIFEMPPRLWPSQPTLNNYTVALGKDLFGLYFLNSLLVAVTTTLLTVLIASMLAYGFARLLFPGKEGSWTRWRGRRPDTARPVTSRSSGQTEASSGAPPVLGP